MKSRRCCPRPAEDRPKEQLPFDEVGSIAMFPDGRRFVASVYSSRSDVRVVDDFDVIPPPAIALLRFH
jgi:hypothetical protein